VAAIELLVSDSGITNLIRDGKTQMIMSAMQVGKARGNRLLNEELARLVKENLITTDEALSKAVDKPDLASKLGIQLPNNA
jgi:twitching motility protein PilT